MSLKQAFPTEIRRDNPCRWWSAILHGIDQPSPPACWARRLRKSFDDAQLRLETGDVFHTLVGAAFNPDAR